MRRVFGPAVFFVAAACLSAAEPERITFCSYNLKNWLTMDRFDMKTYKTLPAAPKPEEERVRVVKILAAIKPDILGVCEIGTADDLADLQKRLKAAGLDLPHTELAHGGDETRRLALMSRLPIKARHSQTDLTYQIGAQTLRTAAEVLERALQEREAPQSLALLTRQIDAMLNTLILAIETRLPPEPRQAEPAMPDAVKLREVTERLAKLLGNADFTVVQLWNAHRDLLQAGLGEHFSRIDEAVQDYDFDVAARALDAAMPVDPAAGN